MKGNWEEIHESNEDTAQTIGQFTGKNQGIRQLLGSEYIYQTLTSETIKGITIQWYQFVEIYVAGIVGNK